MTLLPFIGLIVFLGVYPKPMLERIEPSVNALITHIGDRTGYVAPDLPDPADLVVDHEGGVEHEGDE